MAVIPSISTSLPITLTAPPPSGSRDFVHPTPHLTQGSIVGEWQLLQLLGEGSWCQVFQACHVASGTSAPADYAVKILKREHESDRIALGMLGQEVRITKLVTHPNVLPVLASHLVTRPYYLLLPFIGKFTIRDLLNHARRLPLQRALWFARQACEALQAIHESGWIHGDVKPSNFIVQNSGRITLIDFGLACPVDEKPANQRSFQALRVIGTPIYAAPERFLDDQPYSTASDMYSLGVMLFELIAGQVPFPFRSGPSLAAAHLTEQPPSPRQLAPGIPPRLHWLMMELLAKNAVRRPSALSAARRLAELEIDTFI